MKALKISVFICTVLVLLLSLTAMAAEFPVTKTELANVAQNKPTTSSDPDAHTIPGWEVSNLTDGDRASYTVSEFGAERAGKEAFTIDLLRRYKVQKIELFDRYDYDAQDGRRFIDVIAANNPDFSDAVTLGSLAEKNDDIFPHQGAFEVVTDGEKAYRYIRIQRTGSGDYQYAEIKVWANQTATDIARGIGADSIISDALSDDAHWVYDFAPPETAFDGNTATCWVEDGNAYRYMRVDLGEKHHIGMIEMSGRDFSIDDRQDDYWSRSYINIYGSNTEDTENSIFDVHSAPDEAEIASAGFQKLIKLGSMANAIDSQVTFPAVYVPAGNETLYGKAGKFSATVDDSQAYRYFTYKKRMSTGAALSTFSLYEINPVVNDVDFSDGLLTINFSDEMNADTVSSSSVYLTDSNGDVLNADVAKKDEYTYTVDISRANKELSYTLTIENTIKNKKNVALAEPVEIDYETLSALAVNSVTLHESADGSGSSIDNFHNLTEASVKANISNFSSEKQSVIICAAQYTSTGMLKNTEWEDAEIESGNTKEVVMPFSIDPQLYDSEIKVFVWKRDSLTPLAQNKVYKGNIKNIYVSAKNGNDSAAGTLDKPFATIERAQSEIRTFNSGMSEDVNVYLMEGTYELDDTLVFSEEDGGKNGYFVNYQAYNNENVVISGGSKIEGFSDEDGDGIYSTRVTDDDIMTIRELYINGNKAVRAKSETKISPSSMYEVDGKKLGYYVNSSDIGLFSNPEDMQLHYSRGWTSVTINVKSLSDAGNGQTLVLMDDIPFELMTTFEPDESTSSPVDGKMYHIFWLTLQNKFYAENALELLDTEGEFYFDKKTRVLYYKPFENENMETASVYVPRLDELVRIKGSNLDNKVKNISFDGITFAHATNTDFDKGFLGDQAQTQVVFEIPESAYAPGNIIVDANITVAAAENIQFENSVFTGLAKVAIGLYDGAENVLINGNAFSDIGDSAVTVGTPQDAYMEDLTDGKNVAYNKKVTSTVNEIGNYAAYANDGDDLRGWNIYDVRTYVPGVTNYTNEYWQVDLEKPYEIDKIILKQRATKSERTDFEILASNSEDFSNYTVLYSIGDITDEKYTESGDITADVTDSEKYRYVRVRKTKNTYFYLPEIEIISKDETTPSKAVCKNNVISNNYITRIGDYNWGAPGIQAYYTEATEISSNYICDIPYSGICFGWGWTGTADSVTSKNTVVKNNRIEDYAQRSYDAGGIYTLGQEPGSEIFGNYIKNQVNAYGAYYPDSGSAYTYVHDNVFEDIDMAFHIHSNKQYDLTVENNYSTNGYYVDKGANCTVEAPIVFAGIDVPEQAAQIIAGAGLTGDYASLASKVPQRRFHLTFEDMYGNIIEENNPNILSMPTREVLIPNYLTRKILEAENVLAMYPNASEEEKATLRSVIEDAEAIQNMGASADRTLVVEERIRLTNAIKAFLDNINKVEE
ncbi:MAG: hypothetical protein E7412_01030 [Ruminococcaceae bacterium]|nr:hypothetical protein [Oscillospiraceae bacterium]